MAFDGIVTKGVITELNKTLIGAKVNKVLQPTKNEIILDLYSKDGGKYNLLISILPEGCRLHLTTHLKSNPSNPFNFCMLLRKYLVGSKILKVSNYDLERTIEVKFETRNELNDIVKRRLYVEIMSRQSNIVLTNENNIIIDCLKHFEDDKRPRLPASPFVFTPILKSSFIDLETLTDFYEIVSNSPEEKLSEKLPDAFIGFSKNFILKSLEVLNIDDLLGVMPLPYSTIYEGLATGLMYSFINKNDIKINLSFIRNAIYRIDELLSGRYDFAVVSRHSAETALINGKNILKERIIR